MSGAVHKLVLRGFFANARLSDCCPYFCFRNSRLDWRGLTRCMEAVGSRTGLLVSVLTKVLCSRLGLEAAGRNSRMVGKGQINKCLSHDTAVITLEPHYE